MSSTIVGLYFKSPIETGGANTLTGLRSGTLIEPAPWVASHLYAVGDLVSSSGTAYSCNMAHTSGASLVADAAKWDSLGACSQAPIGVVNTVYTLYFRAIDSVTALDPGQDSTSNIIFTPPTNTQVSADGSTGWSSTALTLPVTVNGGNRPIYVKQTVTASSSPGGLSIGALAWVAGTRVAQVGTVTPTAGPGSVTLAWAAITGETGYEVDRSTASDFSANLVHLTTSLAAGSTGYINNTANGNAPTNGTMYYYRVRGVSNAGVGPWSATVNSTPTAFARSVAGLIYEDNFNDLTNWCGGAFDNINTTATPSQFTISSGKLHIAATDNAVHGIRPKTTVVASSLTDTVAQIKMSTSIGAIGTATDNNDSFELALRSSIDGTDNRMKMLLGRASATTANILLFKYVNTVATQVGVTASGVTVGVGTVLTFSAIGTTMGAYAAGVLKSSGTSTTPTSGRPMVQFLNYAAPNNAAYDLCDAITYMKGQSVTVTGLPTGYKAELTDSAANQTVMVTESTGTATVNGVDTAITALATGSNFCFTGGATLKIYNASNALVLTQTGVYGGDTWTW